MISYEKKCDICYHQKKMSCPGSEKCYSTIDKPYFVLGKEIFIKYPPTLLERITNLFKKLKGE